MSLPGDRELGGSGPIFTPAEELIKRLHGSQTLPAIVIREVQKQVADEVLRERFRNGQLVYRTYIDGDQVCLIAEASLLDADTGKPIIRTGETVLQQSLAQYALMSDFQVNAEFAPLVKQLGESLGHAILFTVPMHRFVVLDGPEAPPPKPVRQEKPRCKQCRTDAKYPEWGDCPHGVDA